MQAPFYLLAIYAFLRRRNWIRLPAMGYCTVLLTIMPIVLGEQYFGEHATDKPLLVTAVYSAYVVMPLLLLARVWQPQVFASYTYGKKAERLAASGNGQSPKVGRRSTSPARSR